VPCGNLTPEEMVTVSDLADLCGCPFVRLTTGQDILLPLVSRSALPIVYRFARHGKGSADMSLQSFRGHLVSCVGATVCKLGLLDSTAMADAIAMRLDDYFLNKADLKAEFAVKILDMVKISGCANACSAHPAACVGLQGQKRKLGEEMVPAYRFFGKCIEDKRTLAIPEEELTALEDVPDKVLDKLMMALWETTGSGKE